MAKADSYHRGNVKEDLLTVAQHLLDDEGLSAVSVRKLCGEVGVTPGNFYNHYANLDDLLAHLAVRFFRQYQQSVIEARSRHRRPIKRLKAGAREFVRFAMERPEHFRLVFGGTTSSLVMKHEVFLEASEEAFRQTVIELYGEDLYRPNDHAWCHRNVPHAYAYFALLNGLARDVIDGLVEFSSEAEIGPFVEQMVDSLLAGKAFAELGHRL